MIVGCAALPEPFPASHSHGHLLFCWGVSTLPLSPSSPQGGKLPIIGLSHCCDLPFPLARCPGHCPWCEAIAWCDLGSQGSDKQSQAQGTRLRSHGPSERDWPNLSCVTFQPGICLSQLGREKGSDQKGSLCSVKINVSYFCLAVALYSNYINYS